MDEAEILRRLDELAEAKVGGPIPKWAEINNWGVAISELAREAAALIRELRVQQ